MQLQISYVTHPELCSQIVGQFAFMKAMADPEDKNFKLLNDLSLDEVYKKANNFFCDFTVNDEIIDVDECNLSEKITEFLNDWKTVTDVLAVQQNIHYNLEKLT